MDKKLLAIIDSIYKATINGSLKWTLSNSFFNNDTTHRYESISLDGITKFDCRIELDTNSANVANGFYLNDGSVTINNPNMLDGKAFMSMSRYPVKKILEWIYINEIKPKLKVSNQDIVMDNILKGIDISEYRDDKINKVLEEKKEPIKEKNENEMKPYVNLNGKAKWSLFWGDKVKKKIKKLFKKSARQKAKPKF